MKLIKPFLVLTLTAFAFLITSCVDKTEEVIKDKIVLAYVWPTRDAPMPDPTIMTHINFAFGVMNDSCDGVVILNEDILKEVLALRSQNKDLKVLLSIGGWGAGGFSEMARDKAKRAAFVAHCGELTKVYSLDGIDMDWEYPTSSASGIASDPSDTENFTHLIKELRGELGIEKLVTFASAANADFVDFGAVEPYLDFVNLMTYDMGRPSEGLHHSAMHPSDKSRLSVAEAVKLHREKGLPRVKIVVGVPFYARANVNKGFSDFDRYPTLDSVYKGHQFLWDSVAMVPYIAHKDDDTMLCVYDNEESLRIKCDYILKNDLGGIMYWSYGADGEGVPLSRLVWGGVNPHRVTQKTQK